MDAETAAAIAALERRIVSIGEHTSFLERNAESGVQLRLPFADKTALDAFTGWPGLIGFVEDTLTEYLWTTSWKLWCKPPTAFTPSVTSGLTVGNGTWDCVYSIASGMVTAIWRFVFGSTSAVTGQFAFGLPVASSLLEISATAFFTDASIGPFPALARLGGNNLIMRALGTGAAVVPSATVPFTWATSDNIRATATYPLA